jgi:NADH-quinone oxidoreductase subunit E
MSAPRLSDAARGRSSARTAKYPPEQRQSAVMSALAIAQDEHGWLSDEVMEEVAAVLGMAPVGRTRSPPSTTCTT